MKRLFLIAVTMMLCVGCSTTRTIPTISNVEDERQTEPYLKMFQAEMMLRGLNFEYPRELRIYVTKNLTKRFADGTIGLCSKSSNRIRIYLDQDAWNKYDHVGREMLMFHELGHCVLDLPHNMAAMVDGTPYSIMYPSLFSSYIYSRYRATYLDFLAQEFRAFNARPASQDEDMGAPLKKHRCSLRPGKDFSKQYK